MIYAVASLSEVYLYDTEQFAPFCSVSDIHYACITDLAWYVLFIFSAFDIESIVICFCHFQRHLILGICYSYAEYAIASIEVELNIAEISSTSSSVLDKILPRIGLLRPYPIDFCHQWNTEVCTSSS